VASVDTSKETALAADQDPDPEAAIGIDAEDLQALDPTLEVHLVVAGETRREATLPSVRVEMEEGVTERKEAGPLRLAKAAPAATVRAAVVPALSQDLNLEAIADQSLPQERQELQRRRVVLHLSLLPVSLDPITKSTFLLNKTKNI